MTEDSRSTETWNCSKKQNNSVNTDVKMQKVFFFRLSPLWSLTTVFLLCCRKRPTPTRKMSCSVMVAAPSPRGFLLHPWAVRRWRSWTGVRLQWLKSEEAWAPPPRSNSTEDGSSASSILSFSCKKPASLIQREADSDGATAVKPSEETLHCSKDSSKLQSDEQRLSQCFLISVHLKALIPTRPFSGFDSLCRGQTVRRCLISTWLCFWFFF